MSLEKQVQAILVEGNERRRRKQETTTAAEPRLLVILPEVLALDRVKSQIVAALENGRPEVRVLVSAAYDECTRLGTLPDKTKVVVKGVSFQVEHEEFCVDSYKDRWITRTYLRVKFNNK
jgi:hypothetical protein